MTQQPFAMDDSAQVAWFSFPSELCLKRLHSSRRGLSGSEAGTRIRIHGRNELPTRHRTGLIHLFLRQFRSPLIYLLLAAAYKSLGRTEERSRSAQLVISASPAA